MDNGDKVILVSYIHFYLFLENEVLAIFVVSVKIIGECGIIYCETSVQRRQDLLCELRHSNLYTPV